MFSIDLREERSKWIGNYGEEDGSFIENLETGTAERLQQLCGLMRELSIVGDGSTGKKGGRGYASNPIDPEEFIEPHRPRQNSSSN